MPNKKNNSFEDMLQEMMAKLEEEGRVDPESVPENAEGIIKSVLKQEMDAEIERAREELSLQRLQEYESDQRQSVENMDVSGPIDDEVQRLIDESEEEYLRTEASRLELEEFLKYEAEAFTRAARQTESTVAQPEGDLDAWALQRLREMAEKRQDVDGGEVVLDILDEITEDLENRMEKERAKKGSVATETLKEWQMYRAIATKIGREKKEMTEEQLASITDEMEDEEIVRRLGLWKEYVSTEERLRDEGGLSRRDKNVADESERPPPSDRQSRAETRKKINRMSIEALESLMKNSDPARREKLQKEIDFLKAELEGKDYLDFEEPEEEDQSGPIDMSGVFGADTTEKKPPRTAEERRRQQEVVPSVADPVPSDYSEPGDASNSVGLPPDTPFFSQDESSKPPPPPPNTPFFSEGEDVEGKEYENSSYGDSKLGSMEEQKLASLYRRAGARTRAEQDQIRAGWEEYQRVEKQKRKLSGLDESADSESETQLSAKFNVSEVMTEDGDFDAQKILSSIGPRPKRGAKKAITSSVPLDSSSDKEPSNKTPGKEEIASSLYRSVSAVGGDRFKDDPEAKARDQAEFQSFLQKESELRQSLDQSSETPMGENLTPPEDFDEEEYAEEALSSLGPRPKPSRSRRVDPREYSDMGGALYSREEDDDLDADDDDDSETDEGGAGAFLGGAVDDAPEMPEWLKRENAEARNPKKKRRTFLGDEVEEAFDDDQYEKNMRQLAEYERRRAGKQASMGIDISDVLGRRTIEDYKDYKFDEDVYGGSRGWGEASFADRKRNLVQYTELDLAEINSLMDHRDSVHSTGVSQYTKRINKPFEAFGAIFRLEGVFADLSGLHEQAWMEVAEKEGLRQPNEEEIRRASVVHPQVAVREVLVWTDDLFEAGRIARVFRETFDAMFTSWAEMNDLVESTPEQAPVEQGSLAIGEDLFQEPTPSPSANLPEDEGKVMELLFRAWTQVAFEAAKPVPTEAQIQQAALVTPDIAIQQVFRWSSDKREVSRLENEFQALIRKLSGNATADQEKQGRSKETASQKQQASPGFISEAAMMEANYVAWTRVAEQFNFEAPTPDEVLGAFVLNDPGIAARDGFGWTDDADDLSQIVQSFANALNEAVAERAGASAPMMMPANTPNNSQSSPKTEPANASPSSNPNSPSFEEVLEMNQKAWDATAAVHGFKKPPKDFVKLSINVDPKDVIARIFRWSWDGDQMSKIAATFREKLKVESEAFVSKYGMRLEEAVVEEMPTHGSEQVVSSDELYLAAFNAWTETANVHNLPPPTREQVMFAMSVGPDEAITKGFGWTADKDAAYWVMETYKEKIEAERERLGLDQFEGQPNGVQEEEKPLVVAMPGAYQWIASLREYEMQCGVISHLNKDQVAALLKFTKLDELLGPDVCVSANNGYKTDSQQMLGAALRLERKPDHCVVFDSSPYASVAAHEHDMRSVGLIGSYPRYELLSADTTASGFQELTAFNIRRLFGERIFDQPELDRQQADPSYQKKVRTKFDWGDD